MRYRKNARKQAIEKQQEGRKKEKRRKNKENMPAKKGTKNQK